MSTSIIPWPIPLDPATWLQRAMDGLFALPDVITRALGTPEELSWVLTLGCVFVLWLAAICICRWTFAFLQWAIAHALWIALGGPLRLAMQRRSVRARR